MAPPSEDELPAQPVVRSPRAERVATLRDTTAGPEASSDDAPPLVPETHRSRQERAPGRGSPNYRLRSPAGRSPAPDRREVSFQRREVSFQEYEEWRAERRRESRRRAEQRWGNRSDETRRNDFRQVTPASGAATSSSRPHAYHREGRAEPPPIHRTAGTACYPQQGSARPELFISSRDPDEARRPQPRDHGEEAQRKSWNIIAFRDVELPAHGTTMMGLKARADLPPNRAILCIGDGRLYSHRIDVKTAVFGSWCHGELELAISNENSDSRTIGEGQILARCLLTTGP